MNVIGKQTEVVKKTGKVGLKWISTERIEYYFLKSFNNYSCSPMVLSAEKQPINAPTIGSIKVNGIVVS